MTPWFAPPPPDSLDRLRAALQGNVRADIVRSFDEYVDHGEAVLAVEQLFDDLDDNDQHIARELADLIVEVAHDFRITRFSDDEVHRLIRPDDGPAQPGARPPEGPQARLDGRTADRLSRQEEPRHGAPTRRR